MSTESMRVRVGPIRGRAWRLLACLVILACLLALAMLYWRTDPVASTPGVTEVAEQPAVVAEIPREQPQVQPQRVQAAELLPGPELTAPSSPGYYGIVARQIVQTRKDYEVIPVTIPADPRAPSQTAASRGTQIEVWAPYWINDDKSA